MIVSGDTLLCSLLQGQSIYIAVTLTFAGACQSQITFIDGKEGVLVYRGYVLSR